MDALASGGGVVSGVRAVWLTREQRDVLEWAKNHLQAHAADLPEHRVLHGQFLLGMSYAARDALAAWDAAPADPAEAVLDALEGSRRAANGTSTNPPGFISLPEARGAVLRALGMPEDAS